VALGSTPADAPNRLVQTQYGDEIYGFHGGKDVGSIVGNDVLEEHAAFTFWADLHH
jgi:hypothetical protein